jgi:hypothetical protein
MNEEQKAQIRATREARREAEWAERDAEYAERARLDEHVDQAAVAVVDILPGGIGTALAELLDAMKPFRASDGHMSFAAIGRSSPEVLALAEAILSEAAAQSPAPKLCGCADAERTYEQLLDYTAELGGELDRQRALIAAVLAECERRVRVGDIPFPPIMTVAEIRALLGGEGR